MLKNPKDFSTNGMRNYNATVTQKQEDVKTYAEVSGPQPTNARKVV